MAGRGRGVGAGNKFQIIFNAPTASEAIDQYIWVADAPCKLINAVFQAATVSSGACTADVKKTPAGTVQAVASGTTMLAGTYDCTTTANTPTTKNPSATAANTLLAVGDSVGLDFGTTTGMVGFNATLTFEYIGE